MMKAGNKKPSRVPAELGAIWDVTAMQQQQQPGDQKDKSPEGHGWSSSSTTATGSGSSGDGEGQQRPRRRLVWTSELHEKFVKAYRTLGRDAVPKKILGLMDVEGLTRDHVASHLQKYRENLRRRGQPPVRRRDNGRIMHARVLPDARRALPPRAPSASASLHHHHQRAPPPRGQEPFAVSLPQPVQGLHAAPPNRYGSHARIVIRRHPNMPGAGVETRLVRRRPDLVAQPVPVPMPMQHRLDHPSVLQLEAAMRQQLSMDHQTQQAAAAASVYNHMPVMSYELGAQIRGATAASGAQNHRPPPHMQACRDVDMSGATSIVVERSVVSDARVGDERTTEARMAQLQIAVESEAGQERAANYKPAAAPAPVDPDNSHQDDLVDQYLISEPSWGYGFPPSKHP